MAVIIKNNKYYCTSEKDKELLLNNLSKLKIPEKDIILISEVEALELQDHVPKAVNDMKKIIDKIEVPFISKPKKNNYKKSSRNHYN